MGSAGAATVLHADLDAYYASVEQLLDPSLRGRPIAVGSGVVLAASYEARAFGVHGGMPGWRARQSCPQLQFVDGHFHEYQRLGDRVVGVLRGFTPSVERISIDEAFLNVAGAARLFGSPAEIAHAIRRRVREDTGLALSVGVARTKHLAKIASQVAKPDGLVVVEPDDEDAFLAPLPVELMWGVGPATRDRLLHLGVRTIGDLAAAPTTSLERTLGAAVGSKLASLARNVDPRHVAAPGRPASVGAQAALGRRRITPELVRSVFGYLADRVGGRLRAHERACRTVTVRVRFPDLRSLTRSITVPSPVSSTLTLTELAAGLAFAALADHPNEREVTLFALSSSHLVDEHALQLGLPLDIPDRQRSPTPSTTAARWSTDRAVDAVRARFGRDAVGYAGVTFSDVALVPDAFRELAERK